MEDKEYEEYNNDVMKLFAKKVLRDRKADNWEDIEDKIKDKSEFQRHQKDYMY